MHTSRGFVPADPPVALNHWGFSSGGNRVCQATPQSTRIWRTTRNDQPLVTKTRQHLQHNYPVNLSDHDVTTTRTYTSSSSSPRSMSPPRSPRLKVKNTTNTPEVEDTEYGKKIKLVIDIGNDYSAEDIKVSLHYKKVSVQAVHEDNTGGRTSRRQFSRDYDLPLEVEGRTLRATLSADNKLHIGASAKENKEHDVIIGFIIQDMPRGGRKCAVEF
jgi:HSP20 family molecular chaperone IbpA